MPKIIEQNSQYVKVQFSKVEIELFNLQWFRQMVTPSRLEGQSRSYWFEFDACNGDLIDTDVPEQDQGLETETLEKIAWAHFEEEHEPEGEYERYPG